MFNHIFILSWECVVIVLWEKQFASVHQLVKSSARAQTSK